MMVKVSSRSGGQVVGSSGRVLKRSLDVVVVLVHVIYDQWTALVLSWEIKAKNVEAPEIATLKCRLEHRVSTGVLVFNPPS